MNTWQVGNSNAIVQSWYCMLMACQQIQPLNWYILQVSGRHLSLIITATFWKKIIILTRVLLEIISV